MNNLAVALRSFLEPFDKNDPFYSLLDKELTTFGLANTNWYRTHTKVNKSFNEEDGRLIYELEVPGFEKEDLSVKHESGYLVVKGERKKDNLKIDYQDYVGGGSEFTLSAKLKSGILTIITNLNKKSVEIPIE